MELWRNIYQKHVRPTLLNASGTSTEDTEDPNLKLVIVNDREVHAEVNFSSKFHFSLMWHLIVLLFYSYLDNWTTKIRIHTGFLESDFSGCEDGVNFGWTPSILEAWRRLTKLIIPYRLRNKMSMNMNKFQCDRLLWLGTSCLTWSSVDYCLRLCNNKRD